MPTLTWSFVHSVQSWTFSDDSTPNASASVSHDAVEESLEHHMIVNATGAGRTSVARSISPDINVTVAIGDTIELDFGPPSDAPTGSRKYIDAVVDGVTTTTSVPGAGSGTLTHTVAVGGNLDRVDIRTDRGNGAATVGYNLTLDLFEVRVITAGAAAATAGKLRAPATALGSGSDGNIADIDRDGTFIYIAAVNNFGFPTLVKIATGLGADGTIVFNPGASDRIGVQCGQFFSDRIWIAGAFDGTNVIEKSENGGDSFTVKDDGTIGAVRAFRVGPHNDDRVIVFDESNGDLIETVDDGASWTTINAAVTPEINTMARFDLNPEEMAIVNDAGASNSINYTVNSGANLEDFQTGVYPNVKGTGVLVYPGQ